MEVDVEEDEFPGRFALIEVCCAVSVSHLNWRWILESLDVGKWPNNMIYFYHLLCITVGDRDIDSEGVETLRDDQTAATNYTVEHDHRSMENQPP